MDLRQPPVPRGLLSRLLTALEGEAPTTCRTPCHHAPEPLKPDCICVNYPYKHLLSPHFCCLYRIYVVPAEAQHHHTQMLHSSLAARDSCKPHHPGFSVPMLRDDHSEGQIWHLIMSTHLITLIILAQGSLVHTPWPGHHLKMDHDCSHHGVHPTASNPSHP